MSDSLGDGEGNPTLSQIKLYERWAQGGVALSIIGEVQCDPHYPEAPGNLVLDEQTDLAGFKALTEKATINQSHIWPQLGHAGAMSHPDLSRPKGPSALKIEAFECDELSVSEIRALPETFANSARLAKQCGFTGIQLHAAHGFLLSQFLSPLFNRRSDEYGGNTVNRCRIVIECIEAIRSAVGNRYPIAIKINATDQIQGGINHDIAIEVISLLNRTSV
ncbi:MAG: oxidoreductase, partial [Chloroflexota bacterium]